MRLTHFDDIKKVVEQQTDRLIKMLTKSSYTERIGGVTGYIEALRTEQENHGACRTGA